MRRPTACLIGSSTENARVWGSSMNRLQSLAEVIQDPESAEVLLSTWGMPVLNQPLPKAKLILYAAGDVRYFAKPWVEAGIPIVSAWRANALPVAEFTMAQIMLAAKGWHRSLRGLPFATPGTLGYPVALLGLGAIGQLTLERLRSTDVEVLTWDAFLAPDEIFNLGAEPISLKQAFVEANFVSNHLANNAETRGLITAELLFSLPENGVFLNTGRGQTVEDGALESVFSARPDLTAILDVTHPEPLPTDHPLRQLPNVFISPHIAGAMGREVERMAELCLDELERWILGAPLLHLVPPAALID